MQQKAGATWEDKLDRLEPKFGDFMPMRRLSWLKFCVFTGLWFAWSLLAGAEEDCPLVVDLTTYSTAPRFDAVSARIAKETPYQAGTYPLISGADPSFLSEIRWYMPSQVEPRCAKNQPPLKDQLLRARRLIVEVDFSAATQVLDQAIAAVACQSELAIPDELSLLYYLEAVAYHYAGDIPSRDASFRDAALVSPGLAPVAGFAPDIAQYYSAAVRLLTDRRPLLLPTANLGTEGTFYINGLPTKVGPNLELPPGRHVIQLMNGTGIARTALIQLNDGIPPQLDLLNDALMPEKVTVLNGLIRASLQQGTLGSGLEHAIAQYATRHHHPLVFFAIPSNDSKEPIRLEIFRPGVGLLRGMPATLTPLPPMTESPSVVVAAADRAMASKPVASDSTPDSNQSLRSSNLRADSSTSRFQFSMDLGGLRYDGVGFISTVPHIAIAVLPYLVIDSGIIVGGHPASNELSARHLWGIEVGASYPYPFGDFSLRAGASVQALAARILWDGQRQALSIEVTPHLTAGVLYPVSDSLHVGFGLNLGLSPGIVGPEDGRFVAGAGLKVGWHP